MNATSSLTSIGCLASQIQFPVSRIQSAAAVLLIQPSHIINGIAYYSSRDAERISDHLRGEHGGEQQPAGAIVQ